MRNLTTAQQTALAAQVIYPAYLAEAAFPSGTVRFWTGYGTLSTLSTTWTGTGDVFDIAFVDETTDLRTTQAVVTLAGDYYNALKPYLGDLTNQPYTGGAAKCYVAFFTDLDDPTSIIGDPYLMFDGLLDDCSFDTGRVVVNIANRLADLLRPREIRYNDAGQRAIYPSDAFFEFTSTVANTEVTWG